MLIILFGLSGTGKNFAGNIFAENFNFHFWDADNALLKDMHESISKKQLFTQEMRDQFVDIVIENIQELQVKHENIVVAQGLYKEKNRKQLQQIFPEAIFLWVKADVETLAKRFQTYPGMIDIDYAQIIHAQFEEPALAHQVLLNSSDKKNVYTQIEVLISNHNQKIKKN